MADTQIDALPNTQDIGWADTLIERLSAGVVKVPGLSVTGSVDCAAIGATLQGLVDARVNVHGVLTNNPHSVTKSQVGLGNVPNTDATARANHTGTQLASTISDFNSTVTGLVGSSLQAWDADLDALAALAGTNTIYYRSGAATWSAVSIGSNLTFSAGTLSAPNLQPLDADLTALAALSGTNTIYYRSAADTWSPVTIGSNLTFSAGTLSAASVADGDKGDITVSASGATWTVDAGAITLAKLVDATATKRILGRNTAGAGDFEEVTIDSLLDWVAGTPAAGDLLYRGASAYSRLASGTTGSLMIQAVSGDPLPQWSANLIYASNILEMRNGATAQELKVYNTYTSSTNNEYLQINWTETANQVKIAPFCGSAGGTTRALVVGGGAAVGTNIAGANLTLAANRGTGNGAVSSIVFNTPDTTGSGSTVQTNVTRLTLTSNLTFANGVNIAVNTSTGTKIGTATTQKLGFWNATAVVQNTGWSTSNSVSDKTLDANSTTLDEVADVLCTLIETLKTYGLLG